MTAPSDFSLGYLLGRLAIVEARVAAAVAERRRTDPSPDDAFRGLYLADEHVDRLLGQPGVRRMLGYAPADVAELRSTVEGAADRAEADGAQLRLRTLAAGFGLTGTDVDILLVALAPDVDARFEKLYGYLHDDVARRRASIGLALELTGGGSLDPAARSRFDANAPLRRSGLLLVDDADRPFLTRALRVPDRVTSALLGDTDPPAELRPVLHEPPPLAAAVADRVNRAIAAGVQVIYCKQPVGTWTGSVVVAALAEQGRAATVVDLSLAGPADAGEVVRLAVREARLLDRVLVLGPVDDLDKPALRELTAGPGPLVLYGGVAWDPTWADTGVLGLDLDTLAHRPADRIWADALAAAGVDAEAATALSPFRLAPDQVTRAVAAGRSAAAADGAGLSLEYLAAGARMQNGIGLGRLARHIEPSVGWADLVLPPLPLAGLRHLTDRVRLKDRVLGDWGLRRAGGRGEGVTALFAGEPGTGKTMAAEVVAAELGLDLYVIDLSSVVDKYIGETEKNLERLFAGAEGVHGVLFFDEADALFGKRSEVSDARDRYANLEVAYLLQRMETFDGLAILATNLGSNLDEAFARRLSLVVEFAKPDAEQRLLLWQKSLASVPLGSDVDLDFCATAFELAGGDIRNIAVTVAYVAAAENGIVDMTRLVRAVQLEYRKLGRLCVQAEFGEYYGMLAGAG
jgi:ATPase family associated with various cellular activities (AAA)